MGKLAHEVFPDSPRGHRIYVRNIPIFLYSLEIDIVSACPKR